MPSDLAHQPWAIAIALVFFISVTLFSFVRGFLLDWKYKGPYTVLAASSRQKWKWAAEITFWYTLPVLAWVGVQPVLGPLLQDPWPFSTLFCAGLWPAIFVFFFLSERMDFRSALIRHQWMSWLINTKLFKSVFNLSILRWTKALVGEERWRFYQEGYPSDEAIPSYRLNAMRGSNRDVGPARRWFERHYPGQTVLYTSAATVYETQVYNFLQQVIQWLFSLHGVLIVSEQWLVLKSQFFSWGTLRDVALGLGFSGFFYWIYQYFLRGWPTVDVLGVCMIRWLILPGVCMIRWLILPANLIMVLMCLWSVFMRRPHCLEIQRADIRQVEVERRRRSSAGGYPELTIVTGDKTFKVTVIARSLPRDLFE